MDTFGGSIWQIFFRNKFRKWRKQKNALTSKLRIMDMSEGSQRGRPGCADRNKDLARICLHCVFPTSWSKVLFVLASIANVSKRRSKNWKVPMSETHYWWYGTPLAKTCRIFVSNWRSLNILKSCLFQWKESPQPTIFRLPLQSGS